MAKDEQNLPEIQFRLDCKGRCGQVWGMDTQLESKSSQEGQRWLWSPLSIEVLRGLDSDLREQLQCTSVRKVCLACTMPQFHPSKAQKTQKSGWRDGMVGYPYGPRDMGLKHKNALGLVGEILKPSHKNNSLNL